MIGYWRRHRARLRDDMTTQTALEWAREIIDLFGTDAILTPVWVEVVAGTQSSAELAFARLFLSHFRIADGGKIMTEDWDQAKRLAARVPPDGKRRQLGDCLIRGIAIRLRCDVHTADQSFPKR